MQNEIMDIGTIIKNAKLGRTRKEAQVDTCTVFAAALYDFLQLQGIECQMMCAYPATSSGFERWGHMLVKVNGQFYDSMGKFSTEIYRVRAKIHKSVIFEFEFKDDVRSECYEEDFEELHKFYVKMLQKSAKALVADQTIQSSDAESNSLQLECPNF